jgi:16S rRNA (cytosine967-C5)-methyltransferase
MMRSIALDVLLEVTEKNAYANIALRKSLSAAKLEPRDRALVTELVNETLRNLRRIDIVIKNY